MDVVRNFIHVIGITPEEQLPDKINGQLIQYSDIETIYIPEDKPPAKSVFQIIFQVEIKAGRIIDTPICKTMVVDGVKKFKIMYIGGNTSESATFATVDTPYNTFIEIPKGYDDIDKVEVFVLDAYFSLLDSRRIYGYILYLVHAGYGPSKIRESHGPGTEDACPPKNSVKKKLEIPEVVAEEMLLSKLPIEDVSVSTETIGSSKDKGIKIQELVDIDSEYL